MIIFTVLIYAWAILMFLVFLVPTSIAVLKIAGQIGKNLEDWLDRILS